MHKTLHSARKRSGSILTALEPAGEDSRTDRRKDRQRTTLHNAANTNPEVIRQWRRLRCRPRRTAADADRRTTSGNRRRYSPDPSQWRAARRTSTTWSPGSTMASADRTTLPSEQRKIIHIRISSWLQSVALKWKTNYKMQNNVHITSSSSYHHIRFWYLRCCGCPGHRGRQHLATPHTRSPWIPV